MMQNKKIIAVTGGIGSGKSTVVNIIKDLGYAVYNCDEIYSELLNSGAFNSEFKNSFGNVFTESGLLDKEKLSKMVFSNRSMLEKLNEITHKKIYERAFYLAEKNEISFIEVPLLFESGKEQDFSAVIVILRDESERISAVSLRDNLTKNQIKSRIQNQFDYSAADLSKYYIILNNGSLQDLKNKVKETIKNLLG